MIMGGLLMSAALLLSIYNIYDARRAEVSVALAAEELYTAVEARVTEQQNEQTEDTEVPDYELYPEMEMPLVEIDGEAYIGFLEVPELELSLPVMGGEWSEAKLKKAPCLYSGSVYMDDMIIAGHNYKSHFSGLKSLREGAEISFLDADGNEFHYILAWTEVIEEYDVEQMLSKRENWDLTLFTCTYGGRERYTLRFVRKQRDIISVPGRKPRHFGILCRIHMNHNMLDISKVSFHAVMNLFCDRMCLFERETAIHCNLCVDIDHISKHSGMKHIQSDNAAVGNDKVPDASFIFRTAGSIQHLIQCVPQDVICDL